MLYRFLLPFFGIAAVCFLLIVFFSSTPRLRATSLPQVHSVTIATTTGGDAASLIDLIENNTVNMYVSGEFEDGDGCADIQDNGGNIDLFFYRSGVDGGANCEVNSSNCYHINFSGGGCDIDGCNLGTETTSTYECTLPLQYYSNPTDESSSYSAQNWVALVQATDSNFTTGTFSATTDINSLLALDITPTLAYGILNLASTSISDSVLEVTNIGNRSLDIMVQGTDMTCDSGFVPVSHQRYSLLANSLYDGMTPLESTSTLVNLNLNKQSSETPSIGSLYFKVSLATSSIGGTCTGQNSISGILDS